MQLAKEEGVSMMMMMNKAGFVRHVNTLRLRVWAEIHLRWSARCATDTLYVLDLWWSDPMVRQELDMI